MEGRHRKASSHVGLANRPCSIRAATLILVKPIAAKAASGNRRPGCRGVGEGDDQPVHRDEHEVSAPHHGHVRFMIFNLLVLVD